MPQGTLTLALQRTSGTTTPVQWNATLGVALDAISIPVDTSGGYFTDPLRLPELVDVSRPISFFQMIHNIVALATTGRTLALQGTVTWVNPGAAADRYQIDDFFLTPDFWPADATEDRLIDSDSAPLGYTIAGGTLQPGAILGVRYLRNGASASDTYPTSIQFLAAIRMLYYVRCQKICC